MSVRPSAESSQPSRSQRKRRQAEVVSFDDLIAAHQTDRESGKLPPEGVVLIGVDTEFQMRMRAGFPASLEPEAKIPTSGVPKNSEPKKIVSQRLVSQRLTRQITP
jgi:hypothetical protein